MPRSIFMDSILSDIGTWFLQREAALRVFAKHDCRVEGWFKGEALLCLENLRRQGRLEEFEREVTVGKSGWGQKDQQKIDLRVRVGDVKKSGSRDAWANCDGSSLARAG